MIGLIFGDSNFPNKILKNIKKRKLRYLVIDLSKSKKFKKDKHSYNVSLGQFGKIIKILKKNNCKKVLFAGKVNKPNFTKIKLDLKGIYYIPGIIKSSKLGDAAILKKIINILKKEKITTINSLQFNPELTLKKGIYSKTKPNKEDEADIRIAINKLKKMDDYNFTQGIIIRNKTVLAVEGKGGTQEMIKKCKSKLLRSSGVLVKFPKKKQDLRIDLPTIGINTLKQCKFAGIKGIVLKNNQNIFLDKCKSINYVNKNKMFIKVK
tara:strand:- start:136 stop:930 length:795 start_codon:yes stop_codon:yes gene_type:complete